MMDMRRACLVSQLFSICLAQFPAVPSVNNIVQNTGPTFLPSSQLYRTSIPNLMSPPSQQSTYGQQFGGSVYNRNLKPRPKKTFRQIVEENTLEKVIQQFMPWTKCKTFVSNALKQVMEVSEALAVSVNSICSAQLYKLLKPMIAPFTKPLFEKIERREREKTRLAQQLAFPSTGYRPYY